VSVAKTRDNEQGTRPRKPKPLCVRAKNIPRELRKKAQWVLWKYVWNPKKKRKDGSGLKGDWGKPLFSARTGRHASSTDPSGWATFKEALAAYRDGGWDGVGFIPLPEDGLVGIDLDTCRDPDTGDIEPWAATIVDELATYTEISPSGTGLRIVAKGHKPDRQRSKKGLFEMYDGLTTEGKPGGRYLTFTGHVLEGAPTKILERQTAITAVYERELKTSTDKKPKKKAPAPSGNGKATDDNNDQAHGLSDEEIVALAKAAKNGANFSALWSGDKSGYTSDSEPDLALCNHLAFWTRKDAARMDRLFRHSGLMRDKWDREDYRTVTINKAIADCTEVYEPKRGGKGKSSGKDNGKESHATKLVQYALGVLDLWHTPEGEAFATTKAKPHQSWALRSKTASRFLARLFYLKERTAAGSEAVSAARNTLEGIAIHDEQPHPVFTRIAEHEGKIFIDLGGEDWRAVAIGPDGWEVVDEPPVKFRRSRGMLPLPVPASGGTLDELRKFVNVADDDGWRLLVAWLIAALLPKGPFPVLCLNGQQGSGKSTKARLLKLLVDPNSAPLRSEPRDPRDLIIAATNSWVVSFDNLSHLKPWLSDALCRLATGGGFSTRQLYSDADEMIFDAMRPAVLNGIEDLATRGDLLERALILTLEPISDRQRRTEGDFWREFEEARPRILGALFDVIAAGLKNLPTVRLTHLPRMADFARWVTACEPALGWEREAFLRSYRCNMKDANELALGESPLVAPLWKFLEAHDWKPWQGTASELLDELNKVVDVKVAASDEWPKRANELGGQLRRLAPNLRRTDLEITFIRDGARRTIKVAKSDPFASRQRRKPPSSSSQVRENAGETQAGSDDTVTTNDDSVTTNRRHESPVCRHKSAGCRHRVVTDDEQEGRQNTGKSRHHDNNDNNDNEIHTSVGGRGSATRKRVVTATSTAHPPPVEVGKSSSSSSSSSSARDTGRASGNGRADR
jgi:primase-polymerase (primpol)-like protein